MHKFTFAHKNVLVIGLGISGFGVAKLLKKLGANVIVNEQSITEDQQVLEVLTELGIKYYGGGHDNAYLTDIDIVVKNPGIPYYAPFIQEIMKRNIPIITEPEVAFAACKAKIIALTGTNGKTTTTMLIYAMLQKYFNEVYYAGNIGVAFSEVVSEASADAYIILELSSFQLMGMPTFKPDIAMILNLDEAHLDYHASKEEYIQAKLNIFKNQTATETLIINDEDKLLLDYVTQKKPMAQLKTFSTQKAVTGAYVQKGMIYYQDEMICATSDSVLPGAHNIQNVLASITVAKQLGVDNQSIMHALQEFSGVEHRLEYVQTLAGRRFYNDSKSTNTKAAQIALSAFQQPIIWIAGGLDRGNDVGVLRPFCEHVKAIVSYGESQAKFCELGEQMRISTAKAIDLEEAVNIAYDFSDEGDIILLSPACASWDQFTSFEQRGTLFKKYCRALKTN